jgi:hypothetical protein
MKYLQLVIALSVICLLSCAKKPETGTVEQPAASAQTVLLPSAKYIVDASSGTVSRHVDDEYGNVCYFYGNSISCVPIKR